MTSEHSDSNDVVGIAPEASGAALVALRNLAAVARRLDDAHLLTEDGHASYTGRSRQDEIDDASRAHDEAVAAAKRAGATDQQIIEWDR